VTKAHERGAASIVMVGILAVAVALCFGVARLGTAAIASARADAAADSAALAAADMMALGRGQDQAVAGARSTAEANDAVLVRCSFSGRAVTVVVRVAVAGMSNARATARAEVVNRN
jgi:secretion/DNA translocation related TadE-like protein